VDGREELGMDIVGQFRVPGDDARFVWIRRYLDPAGRAAALTAFYGGSVWKEFGPRANELMVDHTDVHLLVPDPSGPLFAANHVPLARRDGPWEGHAVVAAIYDRRGTRPGAAARCRGPGACQRRSDWQRQGRSSAPTRRGSASRSPPRPVDR
jgi:hypothetical protein